MAKVSESANGKTEVRANIFVLQDEQDRGSKINDLGVASERKDGLLDPWLFQSRKIRTKIDISGHCQANIEVVTHGTYCKKENV